MRKLFLPMFLVFMFLVLMLFTFLHAEELEKDIIYKYFRGDGTTGYRTIKQAINSPITIPSCIFINDYNVWSSSWVLTVENVGEPRCVHDWVNEEVENWGDEFSCLVVHDERGCPNTWGVKRRICRSCLRKEVEREERYFTKRYLDYEENKKSKKEEYRELEKKVEEFKK